MNQTGNCYNNKGQRAGNCVEFDWSGKHGNCQLYIDWQDVNHPCVICKGQYCEAYNPSKDTLIKLSESKGVYR